MVAGKAVGKLVGQAPQVGMTKRLPSPSVPPSGPPSAGSPTSGQPSQKATKPKAKPRSTSFTFKPGKGGDVRIVKLEFLFGFAVLLLAPLANKDLKFNTNYVKRLIAFVLLFTGLFGMADNHNTSVSRLASGVGGILLLALLVYSPSNKFSVRFADLANTIVQRLQPK